MRKIEGRVEISQLLFFVRLIIVENRRRYLIITKIGHFLREINWMEINNNKVNVGLQCRNG